MVFALALATTALAASCNDKDKQIWGLNGSDNFNADVKTCALRNGGQNPGTGSCMSDKRGYSYDCGQCFGKLTSCTVARCVVAPGNCGINSNGAACKRCVNDMCTPIFTACSGLTPPATLEEYDSMAPIIELALEQAFAGLQAPLADCTSADTQIWNSKGSATFSADLKKCAMRCGGQNPCTGNCVSKDRGYTKACGQCFGGLSSCTVRSCLGSEGNCAINQNGSKCKTCVDKHCTPEWQSCTGWTAPALWEGRFKRVMFN